MISVRVAMDLTKSPEKYNLTNSTVLIQKGRLDVEKNSIFSTFPQHPNSKHTQGSGNNKLLPGIDRVPRKSIRLLDCINRHLNHTHPSSPMKLKYLKQNPHHTKMTEKRAKPTYPMFSGEPPKRTSLHNLYRFRRRWLVTAIHLLHIQSNTVITKS